MFFFARFFEAGKANINLKNKKRIFISYDYDTDREFIAGIQGIAANPNIDFDFYNESVTKQIQSHNEAYVKSKLRDKIQRSSTLLCIVGRNTHSSQWVRWEVSTALALGKKVIFMRRKGNLNSTVPFRGTKTVHNWDVAKLQGLV